jgi:DNA-directed RNA polymerase subunit RPC12/RpoP
MALCLWVYDSGHEKWDTECGQAFTFLNDGVAENGFVFCPYCGRRIMWQRKERR